MSSLRIPSRPVDATAALRSLAYSAAARLVTKAFEVREDIDDIRRVERLCRRSQIGDFIVARALRVDETIRSAGGRARRLARRG